MFFITGDTHGIYDDFIFRFNGIELKNTDNIIICGDFGFLFSELHKERLEKLKNLGCNILFIDGNHENFPMLYSFPVESWKGGKIHRISENIIHLMRGQVFEIENKNFFTMGGAYSTDRGLRIDGESWWKEELPNNDEYHTAIETLKKINYKVDYILTHTGPESAIIRMKLMPNPREAELTGFLEWIRQNAVFERWYFGHFHQDIAIDERTHCLFRNVVRLE